MSEIESPLEPWMRLPEPEARGIKTSKLRFELVSDDSSSIHGQEKHISDLLKNVLVSGCWREYVPTWISKGPYGNDRKVCYENPAKTVVKHKSLEDWIENGLRLKFPTQRSPLERLVLRVQTVLPERYHSDLIATIRQTAAVAGKPMTTTERASIAGSGNRKVEQAELDFDSTTTINSSSSTESLPHHSQSRHIAELAEKSPECFEEYKNGDTTLNAARIKAGLQVKTYAFNSTTKPQKLAEHVMSAYGDQDEKMASLLCTLITSYAHDRWHPDQLSGILAALSCPIRTVTEDDE